MQSISIKVDRSNKCIVIGRNIKLFYSENEIKPRKYS
jgi:hypothetical protein